MQLTRLENYVLRQTKNDWFTKTEISTQICTFFFDSEIDWFQNKPCGTIHC